VLELEFFSVNIENMDGIAGRDGVGTSLNVSKVLDTCIVAFESTIELCIVGKLSEATYDEGWEDSVEFGTHSCESETKIYGRVFGGVVYSIFLGLKMSLDMFDFGLLLVLLLLLFCYQVFG
jgi:hypothetical protein